MLIKNFEKVKGVNSDNFLHFAMAKFLKSFFIETRIEINHFLKFNVFALILVHTNLYKWSFTCNFTFSSFKNSIDSR